MIPTYGQPLADQPDLARETIERTARVLNINP